MLKIFLYYSKTQGDLEKTTHIKVTSIDTHVKDYKDREIVKLRKVELDTPFQSGRSLRSGNHETSHKTSRYIFTYKYTSYIYNEATGYFEELKYDFRRPFKDLKAKINGIKESEHESLITMYGPCVMELYIKPWILILLQDVVNAFYMFQIFSLSAWMTVVYYQYGTTIIFMIAVSLYGEFSNIYESLYRLKDMAYYQ